MLVLREVDVDGIVAVGTADTLLERQVQHLRLCRCPPLVGFLTGQSCAVDTALLSGSDTNGLSVLNVTNRVALRVFECDERNLQVAESLRSEFLILCRHVLEQLRIAEVNLVAALLECYAEYLLVLDGVRAIFRVNLYDAVVAFLLCLQNLEGLGVVVGSDDTVADLALDELAVATSTLSLRAQKSPKEHMRSAPRAPVHRHWRGE